MDSFMGLLWTKMIRPLLFRLGAETAHNFVLKTASVADVVCRRVREKSPRCRGVHPDISLRVAGVRFPNPFILAAGMDKDGMAPSFWAFLGFGAVEIGTLTPRPQPGNERPRLFRIGPAGALINRMGFNNSGADMVSERLRRILPDGPKGFVLGVNGGKNKATGLDEAPDDYTTVFERFTGQADYFTINVSSPNTPGLRDLQSGGRLPVLLERIRAWNKKGQAPVFLKVAPDAENIVEIAKWALEYEIAGLIIGNTTIQRPEAVRPYRVSSEKGGLSGRPLRDMQLRKIREVKTRFRRLPVIGCGGIFGIDDAEMYWQCGADLLQIFTGLVYQGPLFIRSLIRALCARMKRERCDSFAEYLRILRARGLPELQTTR